MAGRLVRIIAAPIWPQFGMPMSVPKNLFSSIVSGRVPFVLARISARLYSFQISIKISTNRVAIAGFRTGRMICVKQR